MHCSPTRLTPDPLTAVFTRSGGTSTGTIGATTDNGNGTYTATFTGTGAGSATTIGATIGGSAVTSALPTITVTPGSASLKIGRATCRERAEMSVVAASLKKKARDGAGGKRTGGGVA